MVWVLGGVKGQGGEGLEGTKVLVAFMATMKSTAGESEALLVLSRVY